MFARPRVRKDALRAPSKKRKREHAVEEIAFDGDSRLDYLKGFHKRKQQRIKYAQELAAKKAREDKIAFRKQVRMDWSVWRGGASADEIVLRVVT
jgi:ribosomal RNA-processing protein 17